MESMPLSSLHVFDILNYDLVTWVIDTPCCQEKVVLCKNRERSFLPQFNAYSRTHRTKLRNSLLSVVLEHPRSQFD